MLSGCLTVTAGYGVWDTNTERMAPLRENQVKLTVSVPPSLHVLLRSWAQCEGRELTSVVLQCVELSVRQLKSNGAIPAGAVRNYEVACEERLAAGGTAP